MNQALPRAIVINETESAPPQQEESGFGVSDLMSVLFSQRLFMLAIVLVTLLAGFFIVRAQSPAFSATALVGLGSRQTAEQMGTGQAQGMPPDTALVESEIEALMSNDMIGRLIAELGPERTAYDIGLPDSASYATAAVGMPSWRDLVKALQGKLTVARQATSNVISVTFETPSPQASVAFADALIDVYLESKDEERRNAAERASGWLDERVTQMRDEVDANAAKVARFREATRLLPAQSSGGSINEQQFFDLQGQVVSARADLAEKEARLRQLSNIVRGGGSVETALEVLNSPNIQRLRASEATISGKQADLNTRYGPKHPATQQVERERQEVLAQIRAEIARIQQATAHEVDVAKERLRELQSGLSEVGNSLVDGNKALVELRELERDLDTSTAAYQDYLNRAGKIADQESLKVTDARRVSRAIEPSAPSSTSPKLMLAFFGAAGVFLALVAAIVRTIIDDRLIRSEDISRRLKTTALVSVPLIHRSQLRKLPPDERTPEDYLVSQPMTAFAEALRVLNVGLMSDAQPGRALTVAVTSAVPSEGKTTVSMSLGRVAAMSGLKVLIIDCDARRPSLSAGVGEKPEISLIDVISRSVDWRQAAVPDATTPALVLPINAGGGQLQTLFRPETMRRLLDQVRPEFDLIVMDCPPVLAVAEARLLSAVADQTVIVTQWNRTRTSAVRTALREIQRAKGHVAGVLLNRTNVSIARRFSFSDSLYYGSVGKGYYTR